ncbi:MAG TPA: TonB-dependent receptor [Vitreimonas sp.]|uniref:TonB-dependent receptor plug domain-containing protein n=1 Tax=Vitreimonas sp. TaxID=3069702 RepID=UPI002D263AB6|nr:TonB-dependent receptor [Vitreimonas sp.]HYD88817.1 TonB-dependent receptor [Vitreimonas sp.]
MRSMRKAALKTLLMTCCFAMPSLALAQDAEEEQSLEEIVITGQIQYRNRTDTVAPELVYDQQFFEQFEPLSVGDQLSRVPGVAFTSDIGERDAPQMRGLGEGFTQVLVNGRPIPGAGNDRTVFVDRIPAEIIDRIEIVRAPSADIDSQGIGGTINIILKDGASLPPGVIARVGGVYDVDNEELGGLGALSFSNRTEDRRIAYSATFDVQQRYNTKVLDQQLFDDTSPGFDPDNNGLSMFDPDGFDPTTPSTNAIEHEDQLDTRESLDLSFNGDLTVELTPDHRVRLDGFYLSTQRDETEEAQLYFRNDDSGDDPGTGNDNGDVSDDPWELSEVASQAQEIEQDSFGVSVLYEGDVTTAWSIESQARYARFLEANTETDFETAVFDGDPTEGERTIIDSDDQEISLDGSLTFNSSAFAERIGLVGFEFEVGVAGKLKTRDYSQRIFADDNDLDFADPGEEETNPLGSGNFDYEERRLDAFMQTELELSRAVTFQAGVRVETTETETSLAGVGPTVESETAEFYPSAHLQWDVGENGQIRLSAARTVRRPLLDQLVPFADEETPGDEDETVGNPNLGLETAWGVDVGYEHRIGRRGVIGINFFHREVSDLISLINTGVPTGAGGFVYSYDNVGDGTVWGWELDVSTPLDFIGLPETGFFLNYTGLDSERTDPFTGIESTFNAQPEFVYNYGITHNIPSWGASVGFSYREQGMSRSVFLGEIEDQWYDGNLEVFVEKRLSDNVVLRVVGNNLLDADSIQSEKNFDGDDAVELRDAMLANDVDEFEIERENSSPTILVTLRAVF